MSVVTGRWAEPGAAIPPERIERRWADAISSLAFFLGRQLDDAEDWLRLQTFGKWRDSNSGEIASILEEIDRLGKDVETMEARLSSRLDAPFRTGPSGPSVPREMGELAYAVWNRVERPVLALKTDQVENYYAPRRLDGIREEYRDAVDRMRASLPEGAVPGEEEWVRLMEGFRPEVQRQLDRVSRRYVDLYRDFTFHTGQYQRSLLELLRTGAADVDILESYLRDTSDPSRGVFLQLQQASRIGLDVVVFDGVPLAEQRFEGVTLQADEDLEARLALPWPDPKADQSALRITGLWANGRQVTQDLPLAQRRVVEAPLREGATLTALVGHPEEPMPYWGPVAFADLGSLPSRHTLAVEYRGCHGRRTDPPGNPPSSSRDLPDAEVHHRPRAHRGQTLFGWCVHRRVRRPRPGGRRGVG